MAHRSYTDEEKRRALALYETDGPRAVENELGIPKATVVGWAQANGVRTRSIESKGAAVQASVLHWEERRVGLAHEMGDVAELALRIARENLEAGKPRDAQAAVTTMAILADKAQLLTGGSTSRGELTGQRQEVIDAARDGALRLVG